MRNRRSYGGAELQVLSHASVRRRGSQVGQGQDPKRRRGGRYNGGSHWENRAKRQHGFDPRRFELFDRYARAPIAAVTARTARAAASGDASSNAALTRWFRGSIVGVPIGRRRAISRASPLACPLRGAASKDEVKSWLKAGLAIYDGILSTEPGPRCRNASRMNLGPSAASTRRVPRGASQPLVE